MTLRSSNISTAKNWRNRRDNPTKCINKTNFLKLVYHKVLNMFRDKVFCVVLLRVWGNFCGCRCWGLGLGKSFFPASLFQFSFGGNRQFQFESVYVLFRKVTTFLVILISKSRRWISAEYFRSVRLHRSK